LEDLTFPKALAVKSPQCKMFIVLYIDTYNFRHVYSSVNLQPMLFL